MHIFTVVLHFILHLDNQLAEIIQQYGTLAYGFLFAIIFAETGFVILPFLPGDSLLFAAGALSALGSLHISVVAIVLIAAAIIGDSVNYWIGNLLGKKIVGHPRIKIINQAHIDKTEAFYKKYGGKAIILARFIPIIRTFAPFVAGVGKMHYETFFLYNIIGGILWVGAFTLAGYFFGNIPAIKEHFSLAVIAIVGLSVVPVLFEVIKHQRTQPLPQKELEKAVNKID